MRYVILFIITLINVVFTAAVFTKINIAGIAPDLIICTIASIAIIEKSMTGAFIGLICGLALDLFMGAIGFYALPYFVSGALLFFVRRHITYIDRFLVPALLATGAYVVKELILALLSYMMNLQFSFSYKLVRYILPEAILTGLVMLLVHLIFMKLYKSSSIRPRSADDFKKLL